MNKRRAWGMAMVAVIGTVGVVGLARAEPSACARVGVWFGEASDAGLKWLGNHTPGTNATTGQLSFQWAQVDPSYGAKFQAYRMTSGEGVWVKVGPGTYKYTWFAYGLMPFATGYQPPMPATMDVPVYALRVTGTGIMTSCDHMDISYTAEFLTPDLTKTYYTVAGTAVENRMPFSAAP